MRDGSALRFPPTSPTQYPATVECDRGSPDPTQELEWDPKTSSRGRAEAYAVGGGSAVRTRTHEYRRVSSCEEKVNLFTSGREPMGRGKHLTGQREGQTEILSHEEVLQIRSEM